MKRYTSPLLKFIALFYMGFPLIYLLGSAILFDVPGVGIAAISISPLFFGVTILAMASGFGLWEMRSWGWHVFIGTNLLTAYLNVSVVINYGTAQHKVVAVLFSLLMIAAAIWQVTRELRVPYFAPRIRWWETNPSHRLELPATVRRSHSEPLNGSVMDISQKGCFIRLREDLPQDARVMIEFTIFGHALECPGTVVWLASSSVTHPKGIGVKFDRMPRPMWKRLRVISRRLAKAGKGPTRAMPKPSVTE